MRTATLFLLAFFAVALGCNRNNGNAKLLPKEKFAELLMEFSVAEAAYSRLIEADTAAMRSLVVRNASILKKHKVSREQFLETYAYYNHHKKELIEVYDLSVEMLVKRTERVRASKDTVLTGY
jgi:hypothetical protein